MEETSVRTLIVDDDFAVVAMHRRFVDGLEGFETVATATTGEEVVPIVREREIDLVLLDVYLPDTSGLEVLGRLRAAGFHQTGVIMITAASEQEAVKRALGQGVADYLVKPFSKDQLYERLRRFRSSLAAQSPAGQEQESLSQAEVDSLLGRSVETPAPSSLPKGLSGPTFQLVSKTLREAGADMAASEVSASCGISRVSSRRYLEYLVSRGLAELRPRYGSTGRPEHRYRWLR
ncbi:response regulator [Arthrobacter castelli]|uniref:response regulator n=1 Tax=Arthrobacter castelli TaxID=271431 RepID=UPI0003F7A349|nr:response regulator [Arthrobacter castelli]